MNERPTYQALEAALEVFGYRPREQADHRIFEHPAGNLMIVLPRMPADAEATSMHLMIVEKTIQNDEVIDWAEFDSYLRDRKRRDAAISAGDRLVLPHPAS